tara:strand:+ start:282 stop:521 length:240 start_codon:yes stop_codon:yes gene_type:complete
VTLCSDTRKGNYPSFLEASRPGVALSLFHDFCVYVATAIDLDGVAVGSDRDWCLVEHVKDTIIHVCKALEGWFRWLDIG